jgi:hypothetical protein
VHPLASVRTNCGNRQPFSHGARLKLVIMKSII